MNGTDESRWTSLWTGGRVYAPADAGGEPGAREDWALGVAGRRLAWVGPRRALPGPPETLAGEVHDLEGRLVTPGLIDCHTHLVFAGERSAEFAARLAGASYREIAAAGGGIRATLAATRNASADELYAVSRPRLENLVANGATTVEIKSGYGLDLETERRMLTVARRLGADLGIEVITTYLGAHTLPPEFDDADRYLDFVCAEALPALAGEGLVDAVDAYCETIAFDRRQTRRVFDAAAALGLPVKLHADQFSDGGGAALAAAAGALSADHLEHTGEAGVAALAEAGVVAVLLPGAYYFLGERRAPPVTELRAAGVPMAVATDLNPGTSPLASLPLAMNLACILFGLGPAEALDGATRHAARALAREPDRGSLEAGRRADFAIWEDTEPAALAYWLGLPRCRRVIAGGKTVWERHF